MTRYAETYKYDTFELIDTIDVGPIMVTSGGTYLRSNNTVGNISGVSSSIVRNIARIVTPNTIRLTVSSEPVDTPGTRLSKMMAGRPVTLGSASFVQSVTGSFSVYANSTGLGYSTFPTVNPYSDADTGKFMSYALGTTTTAVTSTDAQTWVAQALTSVPSFSNLTVNNGPFSGKKSCVNGLYSYVADGGAFWCGARWILVAPTTFASTNNAVSTVDNSNRAWNKVIYANGVYLQNSTATDVLGYLTSTDGITWTPRIWPGLGSTSNNGVYWAVGAGNGMFLAVSGGYTITSTDGVTWTTMSASGGPNQRSGTPRMVPTYGNGVWIHSPSDTALSYTSNNGVTWTAVTGSVFSNSFAMQSIVFGAKFVIVTAQSATGVGGAYTSTDGISWAQGNIPGVNYTWIDVAYSPTDLLYAAVQSTGSANSYATSTDGIAWTVRTGPWASGTVAADSIAYGNGKFYATPNSGTVAAYSSNGIAWTGATAPQNPSLNISYANTLFIIQGNASATTYYTATDAAGTFTSRTANKPYKYLGMAYNGTTLVSMQYNTSGNTTNVVSSTNGTTWTVRALGNNSIWNSISAATSGATGFIILGDSTSQYQYSSDGITWTNGTPASNSVKYTRALYGKNWIMSSNQTTNMITYSSSLTGTWTTATFTSGTHTVENVLYNPTGTGSYIAFTGSATTILSSQDGITWVPSTVTGAPTGNTQGAWNGNGFTVVGVNTPNGWYSPDGFNWTSITLPVTAYWTKVLYTGTQLIVPSFNGQIITSVDGINWQFRATGNTLPNYNDACYVSGTGTTYMSGAAGFITAVTDDVWVTSTSTDGITYTNNTASTVLGSATVSSVGTYSSLHFFYKNGNNVVMISRNFARYSTDGGVTWSNSTGFFSSAARNKQTVFKPNATTAAKIVAFAPTAASSLALTATLVVSTDTGANWATKNLASLVSGGFATISCVAYSGSILFAIDSANKLAKSTDDGTTFAAYAVTGSKGNYKGIFHDGYRFYLTTDLGECFTSTDGSTWTARAFHANRTVYPTGNSDIAAANSSVVVINTSTQTSTYQGTVHYSTDGGVTWRVAEVDTRASVYPNSVISYMANGSAFLLGGQTDNVTAEAGGLIKLTDLSKYNTAKLPTVTALRTTGTVPYVKVG